MTLLAQILFAIFVVAVIAQSCLVLWFLFKTSRASKIELPPDDYRPTVAVILCVRGADPTLAACISGLLSQSYSPYQLNIVVDHVDDDALAIVRRATADADQSRVTISTLQDPYSTCSLKCSCLIQTVKSLPTKYEVIALVDADASPHDTWLEELVAPLAVDDVAVTTGTRWYMPSDPTLGALTRYLWNVGAVIIMTITGIAWGGTVAIKRSAIDKASLLQRWQHSFCEDTLLQRAVRSHGLRQVFVPALIMTNREECRLIDVISWAPRQLLTARLYHRGWWLTLVHGILCTMLPLLGIVIATTSWVNNDLPAVLWALAGLLLFHVNYLILLAISEFAVRRVVRRRDESTAWLGAKGLILMAPAILITEVAYVWILLRATFMKRVSWRGVNYRIKPNGAIQLEQYRPYANNSQVNSGHSL